MKITFTEKFIREAVNRVSWNLNGPVGSGSIKPRCRPFYAEIPRRIFSMLGFVRRKWMLKPSGEFSTWCKLLPRLDCVYEKLEDQQSRNVLLEVVIYRCLGSRAAILPPDSEVFKSDRQKALKLLASGQEGVKVAFKNWTLGYYDLSKDGWPIRLYSPLGGILVTFVREHYAYRDADIAVKEGDVVIDGGGCWGDTALYFAHLVGDKGAVHVFEFDDENLEVLNRNLMENKEIAPRITIAEEALWDSSCETITYNPNGPASSLNNKPISGASNLKKATTVTIDDYVKRESLPKVDFIKMDIEGAEPNALHGAADTIKRHRPMLALSVYHDPEHFVSLMEIINELDLRYEFYMRHLIPNANETVLYAKPM